MMENISKENAFVSLDLPESMPFEENSQSGGLNFLPSNYDLNNTKNSDESGTNTFNLGDIGKISKI